jgi:hypothetical protein
MPSRTPGGGASAAPRGGGGDGRGAGGFGGGDFGIWGDVRTSTAPCHSRGVGGGGLGINKGGLQPCTLVQVVAAGCACSVNVSHSPAQQHGACCAACTPSGCWFCRLVACVSGARVRACHGVWVSCGRAGGLRHSKRSAHAHQGPPALDCWPPAAACAALLLMSWRCPLWLIRWIMPCC